MDFLQVTHFMSAFLSELLLPRLSSILPLDSFNILAYSCHPYPWSVLSIVPKEIQIPHWLWAGIDEVSTKRFPKANIEPQQLCAETITIVDGPSWQSNFGGDAFNPYNVFPRISEARTFLPDAKKRFYPYPVFDSFGWFMPVSASQSDGTKSCKFEDFHVISCGITITCEDAKICWFPFNLAILDHLEQERFWKSAAFFQQPPK